MSKWKNRIMKRVTAVILSGAMIMSGMPLSEISVFAAESSEVEITEESETQDETESTSEVEITEESETRDKTESVLEETAEDEEIEHEVLEESETTSSISLQEELKNSESTESSESDQSDQSNQLIKFSLKMDEIEGDLTTDGKLELTTDYEKNGFTIKVASNTTITVDTSNKTVTGIKGMEGVKLTKRLKLDKNGTSTNYSIHFTAEDAGTLIVYATSGNGDYDRPLGLFKKDGTPVPDSEQMALGSGPTALSYTIAEKGDYYIASTGGGINVYYIQFSNEDENNDKEEDGSEPYAPEEVDAEWTTFSAPQGDLVYDTDEGVSSTLTKYNQEGYAQAANVTGGGLLKEDSPCYYTVKNELEFLEALSEIRGDTEKPHVIEITTDLNLGNLEVNEKYNLNITAGSNGDYNSIFRACGAEPIMHPTLIKTGASYIKMHNFHNLTIFSKNGAMIKHCGIKIEGGTTNLIIRNIVFDELWEWDEVDSGRYKRNDWDYMTIEDNSEGIWIDHCTFYKAYDGIIDLKNDSRYTGYQRVTISWCEVLPGSKNNTFFNEQMTWLEEHKDETTYYKSLFDESMKSPNADKKMTAQDIWWATYGHDKTHLLGAGDESTQDKAIRVTLANSYYKNARSRLPRLRFGKVHEYNCVLEAVELNDQYRLGNPHITGNGPASTCNGEMLIENCYINGVRSPLRSGYGSPTGYIKAVDSIYRTDVKNNDGTYSYIERPFDVTDIITDSGVKAKVTDEVRFREKLPYKNYTKYDASKLEELVLPYAGAGKLTMTTVQWERTNYNGGEGGGEEEGDTGTIPDESGTNPSEPESNPNDPGTNPSEPESNPSESESNPSEPESNPNEPESVPTTNEADIQIVGLEKTYQYTGDKIIPAFDVIDYDISGGKLLALGVDYTVTYKNNKEISVNGKKAEIIVKGKGNYAAVKGNEAKATFEIVAANDAGETQLADIKGAKIRIDGVDDVYYDGTPHIPATITLTLKDKTTTVEYKYNADTRKYERADKKAMDVNIGISNNVNKGTASVLVSGVDDKGKPVKIKGKFKIKPINMSQKTVTIEPGKAVYSPKGAVPETLKVTCEGKELKQGRDYTVKYAKNKAAGTATLTVTGKGNYTKKAPAKDYTIAAADMSDYRVVAVTANDGTKVGKIKATVVDKYENALKAKQYTLEVYPVTENGDTKTVGTTAHEATYELKTGDVIHVVARANDSTNLTAGTTEADFTVGKDISKAKFTLTPEAKKGIAYTGSEIKLEEKHFASVTYKDGAELHMKKTDGNGSSDYEIVSYANNVNKGTATAVIKGINDYSGTKTIKFKITQKSITNIKLPKALEQILEQLSKK